MDQPIRLTNVLRADIHSRIAIVGSGGKTTLLFRLAREFDSPVIVTTSTHLSQQQAALADRHFIVHSEADIKDIFADPQGIKQIILLTGEPGKENWLDGLSPQELALIAQEADRRELPVLIEADGSRCLPLKAPASHEPAIPPWVNQVVVVAGLSGLGQPLDAAHVHRPQFFASLSQLAEGENVSPEALQRVLLAAQGGLKNIPQSARKTVLLNQADSSELQAVGGKLAQGLLTGYDAAVVARLHDVQNPIKAVYSRVAGIILAAGKSSRMGGPVSKVLMEWQGEPFVRKIARTALEAGLDPVVAVTGANPDQVNHALAGLPVILAHNPAWEAGQSASLQAGLHCVPESCGGAIFLLGDQPQVTVSVLTALVEAHRGSLSPIIVPLVEDRRANPVLFDRIAFSRLLELTGDTGGRALFSQYPVHWLPWYDSLLLLDVDTPQDYQRLIQAAWTESPPESIARSKNLHRKDAKDAKKKKNKMMNSFSSLQPQITAVVLAAGASRRMGRHKMLLPWGDTTVIGKVVSTLRAAGVVEPVIVTGRAAPEVKAALQAIPVRWAHNPEYETTEMLQSLQLGIRQISEEAEALLIVLGDQPQIEADIIQQVIRAFHERHSRLIIPSYQHRRGHPWLVHKSLWAELLSMPAEATLRQFLNRHADEIEYLNVDIPSVLMDLDTPEDYAKTIPYSGLYIPNWKLTLAGNGYQVDVKTFGQENSIHSLDDVSLLLPGGAYTTFRTYFHSKAIRFQEHILRLADSARRTHTEVVLHPEGLRSALHTVLQQSPFADARVRVTLDLENEPGNLYISLEELHTPPAEAYLAGVKVNTRVMQRENPRAKLTGFIATAAGFRAKMPQEINETLMVQDDGLILEGLSSNFFAKRGSALRTADQGVLTGITRSIVLDIARKLAIPVELNGIQTAEIPLLDECFITSASRAVLPVVQIDEQIIASGQPGPMTVQLIEKFQAWVESEAKEI
jgi:probable selenium-dependent hydroxylase accessory protein YqeC